MFSFLKKKPALESLLPKGYVDIHNHVLPGIDDGATDLENTTLLLQKMHQVGIAKCIATPHTLHGVWNNSTESITAAFEKTHPIADTPYQTQIVKAASEYMIDNSLMERIQSKTPLLTLKNQTVLVEMSYQSPPLGLFEIIFELQLQGYDLVLAHPERYYFYHSQFSMYEKLKQSRVRFQLNLLSVTGYYGKDVALIAEKLLKAGMIDFTGTDIHNLRHVSFFKQSVLLKNTTSLCEALEKNVYFESLAP